MSLIIQTLSGFCLLILVLVLLYAAGRMFGLGIRRSLTCSKPKEDVSRLTASNKPKGEAA